MIKDSSSFEKTLQEMKQGVNDCLEIIKKTYELINLGGQISHRHTVSPLKLPTSQEYETQFLKELDFERK